jgi:hypothetical protein
MKSPHDFMVDIATSALGYSVRQPLGRITLAEEQPPSLTPEHTDADALWNDLYRDAYADAQLGRGDYWPRNGWKLATDAPKWDNEQSIDITLAAQLAKALIGATDAERWRVFNAKLGESIDQYAQDVADTRTR